VHGIVLAMACVLLTAGVYAQARPAGQPADQKPQLSDEAFKNIRVLKGIPVREFMKTRMPELALHPLLEALGQASPTERRSITRGLNTLAKLLSRTQTPTTNEAFDELDE
jgi:hypothetical protein